MQSVRCFTPYPLKSAPNMSSGSLCIWSDHARIALQLMVCVYGGLFCQLVSISFAFAGHVKQCEVELCRCYSASETLMQHHL